MSEDTQPLTGRANKQEVAAFAVRTSSNDCRILFYILLHHV